MYMCQIRWTGGRIDRIEVSKFHKGVECCFANNVEDKEGEGCETREGMEEEE